MSIIDVSIILPSLNEKDNLVELIPDIQEVLKMYSWEIIVVDDASVDGTAIALSRLDIKGVVVVSQETRKGFARSIHDGLRHAQGECVIVMDSDFNHDPAYLKEIMDRLGRHSCVSGSRFMQGVPFKLHFWASRFLGYLIHFKTGVAISDSLFGFWGMQRKILDRLPLDRIFFGFGDYTFRLFYYLKMAGVTIFEFPVHHGRRRYGKGNQKLIRTFFKYAREILWFKT